ncbi:MAG: putative rane associated protease [Verrucomicrobiaceae bacterium]|nr:putative rane associated protease [Verrucomicrobiaceae bacterium]
MLLGYRVSQKSILWPLVVVMLPGWLLLVSLVRRPNTDLHTQIVLRERIAQQMLAYDYAQTSDSPAYGKASLPGRRAKVDFIYRQTEQAGLIKDPQRVDAALVWLRLGDDGRASRMLAGIEKPKEAVPYFDLIQKTVAHEFWSQKDKEKLMALEKQHPEDWWLNTLASMQGLDPSPAIPIFWRAQWAWWQLRIADWLLPSLGVLAFMLSFSAIASLRGPWSIWPYSERVQHLWPLALMLCVVSLRGLFLLLGNKIGGIILPLISWAGQRDPLTVFHIQVCLGFFFSMLLLAATTYGVKESVAAHWGSLGDVLGFERKEFRDRRLWCLAFPCAVALVAFLQPLPMLLDQWQIGGPSIYDSLSRSPGGYNSLGTVLSVIQAVLLAPFFEEIIYRGFLLAAFRNYFGPLLGILFSSLIYALAHGSSLAGTVTAFAYGVAYAAIKLHTGRISVAILIHACVGAVQIVLMLLQGG